MDPSLPEASSQIDASAAQSLTPELERALLHVSGDRYAESVQRVADFFLAGASGFNEDHVQLFDDILGRLIVGAETAVLAELARRLAPLRNAPRGVICRLARDNAIAVAGPVLTRSTRLDDADLIEIAQTKGEAHRFAISGRGQVSGPVADVLVERGDRDVVRNLAMNANAVLSEAALAQLAERAVHNAVLADKLVQRQDVALNAFRDLLLKARAKARLRLRTTERLEGRTGIEPSAADISGDARDAAAGAGAWPVVQPPKRTRRLSEAQVLELAEQGQLRETISALAVVCFMPIEVVCGLVSGSDQQAVALTLCQVAGFNWDTAQMILRAVNESVAGKAEAAPGEPSAVLEYARCDMLARMTEDRAKAVLNRVSTWPRALQEELAKVALEIEAEMAHGEHTTPHELKAAS